MREIKFRAWDKEKNMWTNFKIFDNSTFFMDKNTGVWFNKNHKEYERFELMQYTGVKDKNGKEIYEGDIIICKYGPQIAMEVKWVDEGFRTLGKYDGDNYVGFVKNNAEVIGNIYENKNLLEENN